MPPLGHWIPAVKTTRVPCRHICLDTEAHRTPGVGGEVQRWRLAATSLDVRRDWGHPWAEPVYAQHATPEGLWDWVAEQVRPGARTVLVAHNLAYDLRISEAFHWLPAMGWRVEHLRMERGNAAVTWTGPRGSIHMVDSLSWLPVPLAAIGDLLGIAKPDLPDDDDSDEAWWNRCTVDVEILRAAWLELITWVHDSDLGSWRGSGAGQAWNHWRHAHYTDRVLAHEIPAVRDAERTSLYSGRVEAWRWGRCGRGPFYEWDYSLTYARICAEIDVPVRYRCTVNRGTPRDFERACRRYQVLAWCDVETDVPVLPTLKDGRRLWPVGRFSSWLWDHEIAMAEKAGAKVTPRSWHAYAAAPALRSWATWALGGISGATDDLSALQRLAVKHWTRALPGRFAARYADWEPYGEALRGDGRMWFHKDADTGEAFKWLDLPGGAVAEGPLMDVPDAAPAVLSRIAAECRIRLWDAMTTAGLDHLCYVDTDGMIVDRDGDARLEAAGLPGMRRKAKYRVLRVFGPRQFMADSKLTAAGIPKGALYLGGGKWGAEVWESLPSALSTGHGGEVHVRERTWRLAGTDERREHLAGGSTAPYEVDLLG